MRPWDVKSQKPANVIWFIADQLRGQALGFAGDPNARTPNIDNLARDGMVFPQAVSGAPWCCPFRGALLTGQYPHQNGVTKTPSPLDPEIPTLVSPLKQAGYHTAYVGKWHLDGSNDVGHFIPPQRRGGFDYFMGYENNNSHNESVVFGTESETPLRLEGYETDALTDLFIRHLENHTGGKDGYQPFFAVLSVQAPHSPYRPPTETAAPTCGYRNPAHVQLRPNVPPGHWAEKAKFDLAGYYGMIENLDFNLGKLRLALQAMGVDKETYIIFTSDHGDCLGSHAQWEKSSPWEESIRIPFIVGALGGNYHIRTGTCGAPLNHIDIAPTTLGLCGIPVPETMVGHDYAHRCIQSNRLEFGKNPPKPEPESAYLQQIPRKFHRHSVNKAWRGVVTKDGWKYVCFPGVDWLLFDLNKDPFELANLCHDTAFQKEKERLHAILQNFITETGDDFPLPDISL